MDEFKSPPPPLPFTFPPDAEDEEMQAGGLENELNGDKNGRLIDDEEGENDSACGNKNFILSNNFF